MDVKTNIGMNDTVGFSQNIDTIDAYFHDHTSIGKFLYGKKMWEEFEIKDVNLHAAKSRTCLKNHQSLIELREIDRL
ncbi:hypothetical protein [Microbulbifer sp. TRSA007]|uniref:hypothetical protein n=1 Tax=Microbulbifer sp. TRSA007 TaxID=3243384 RepID=UPI0040397C73